MADNLTLPQDPDVTRVNVVLTRAAAPYVRDAFNRKKRDGETLLQYVTRLIVQDSVSDRHGLLLSTELEERRDATTQEEARRATELSTVLRDTGVNPA